MSFHVPGQYRIRNHETHGTRSGLDGEYGAFAVPYGAVALYCIASDGADQPVPDQWEHVSVHAIDGDGQRAPTWAEMCHVKGLFWDADDVVVQFHPRQRDYINVHPHTLHLWRAVNWRQPMPPRLFV